MNHLNPPNANLSSDDDEDDQTIDDDSASWIRCGHGNGFISTLQLKSVMCTNVKESNPFGIYILTGLIKIGIFDSRTWVPTSTFAVLKQPFQWNSMQPETSFERLYVAVLSSGTILFRKIYLSSYEDKLVYSLHKSNNAELHEIHVKHGQTITTLHDLPKRENFKKSPAVVSDIQWFWNGTLTSQSRYNKNVAALQSIDNIISVKDLCQIIRNYMYSIDFHGHKILTSSYLHTNNIFTVELYY